MRARVPRARVSHDRWLVSYADFITLLFSLFVVLFAFAKADEKKRMEVTESIDSAFRSFGIFSDVPRQPSAAGQALLPDSITMNERLVSPARVRDDLDHIRHELEQSLASQVAGHSVSIQMGHDGLIISLREAGFFNSGSATPRPETLATLRQIGASLAHSAYDLRIEGHTDNIPIHNAEFDSNWELSSARATRIARLFIDQHVIASQRISAAGYAEYHPVASNDSTEGRAKNRRVDLIVLPQSRTDLALPARPRVQGPWRKVTDGDPVDGTGNVLIAPTPAS